MKILLTARDMADFRWNMDAERRVAQCGCVTVMAAMGSYPSRLCFLHRPRV